MTHQVKEKNRDWCIKKPEPNYTEKGERGKVTTNGWVQLFCICTITIDEDDECAAAVSFLPITQFYSRVLFFLSLYLLATFVPPQPQSPTALAENIYDDRCIWSIIIKCNGSMSGTWLGNVWNNFSNFICREENSWSIDCNGPTCNGLGGVEAACFGKNEIIWHTQV